MPLADEDFNRYCQTLHLSPAACQLIAQVRQAAPARRVRGRAGNVCVRYPSRKMGCVVQAESHRVELAGVLEYEFTPSVLEYYDQPPAIQLTYQTKTGKRVAPRHTPDFFVLRTNLAGWEEWKTEEALRQLATDQPNRYVQVAGSWCCPPGEQVAAEYGLSYRLRSSAEIDWYWQRNLDFLAAYLHNQDRAPAPSVTEAILDSVAGTPGLPLSALLQADFGGSSDDVYALIATGRLYVDLHAEVLAEPERVPVFRDRQTAQAHQVIQVELAAPAMAVSERAAEVHERLIHASAETLARACRRYDQIRPVLAGTRPAESRSERRWLKAYRQAADRYGSGYLGLLDGQSRQGNRTARLSGAISQQMAQQIEADYETIRQQGIHVAYGKFVAACEQQGLPAPSHVTYYHQIRQREQHAQILKREGAKAAYSHEPFYWELGLTTPRHGDWPFQIGHIDHTQLDIELVHSRTKRPLGRPWATFMVDAFARRVLAIELSCDEPSYRACLMALRTGVARYERLPQSLVVDGGAEFHSIYFESLMAQYQCALKTRPANKPRFGSVIERLFGTTNQDFIHNLLGNTQVMRKVRQVTPAVDPKAHATWTLEMLFVGLCEWAYEVYDTLDHAALGQSPREAFTQGLVQSGFRAHQQIPYDENFILATLPTTLRGKAKVEPNRGIKLHYLYYWSEAFRSRLVEGQTVPVRYDPFDAGIAYAFLSNPGAAESGRWVRCLSEYYSCFRGRSEREIRLATAELRKQRQQHATTFTLRAKTLAAFLDSPAGQGTVAAQQARDAEARPIRDALGRPGQPAPADPSAHEAVVEPEPAPVQEAPVATDLELYGDF